jgi:hypothetical protein
MRKEGSRPPCMGSGGAMGVAWVVSGTGMVMNGPTHSTRLHPSR